MTDEARKFLAKTMVFQSGNQTEIWGIQLNTLDIDEHEMDEYLADGWYAHPFHVRDALEQQEEQEAEAARIQAEQEAAERKRLEDEATANQLRAEEEARIKAANDAQVQATNEQRDQLIAEANALGIKIDNRWGVATLQEAIDEAKKTQ